MKIKSLIGILISVFIMTSCQEKDPVLEKLSIMIEESESSLVLLNDFKIEEIKSYKKEADGYLKIMKPHLNNMQQDMIQKLSVAANTVKLIKKKPFDKEKLTEEINFNTTQLKALYTARKQKTMSEKDLEKFIKDEEKSLKLTTQKIKGLKSIYKDIYENFKLFIPHIKHYSDSLTSTNI